LIKEDLIKKKQQVVMKFDASIKALTQTITALSKIPNVDVSSMQKSLLELKAQRTKVLAEIDAKIASIA
jgi:hypothetical protein